MEIITALKNYAIEKQMTHFDIATALGCSTSSVGRWFSGKAPDTAWRLIIINYLLKNGVTLN